MFLGPVATTIVLTFSQLEVDLRAIPADLTIWGGSDGRLGLDLEVGDVDGDQSLDLLFSEINHRGPLGEKGRVCAFKGPIVLPANFDLLIQAPDFCIEGQPPGPGSLSVNGNTRLADLDSDGLLDLVVASSNGGEGGVAVFRGRAAWPVHLDMGLDADWVFYGMGAGDAVQTAVVGDLNGDGNPDLVLFAPYADGPGNARENAGEAYILFGPTTRWPAGEVHLSTTPPDVIIFGADGKADNPPIIGVDGDRLGFRNNSQIGDVTGDGIDDLLIVSSFSAGAGNVASLAGEAYLFHGKATWPAQLDTRVIGDADLVVYGPAANAGVEGTSVADIDADGYSDVLLGSPGFVGLGRVAAGSIFLLRGGIARPGIVDLATASGDAQWIGPRARAGLGGLLTAADVDGDGRLDIVVGAPADPTRLGRPGAGAVYVISGCEPLLGVHDLGMQAPSQAIYGADDSDGFGNGLRAADLNGDGMADVLGGAPGSRSRNNLRPISTGEAHLLLGKPFSPPTCNVVADAGSPAIICPGSDHLLNGSATIVTGCGSSPSYRWMNGSTVVRGWGSDPTVLVRPTSATTFRVEVRCGGCVGACFGSASVLVAMDPDVLPRDLGNSVRAFRQVGDVALQWVGIAEARSYSVFRSSTNGSWPPAPVVDALLTSTTALPDISMPPNDPLYYYRISGANCSGVEGP